MYKTGSGKADITPKTRNIGMMGYGMGLNIAKGKATPLYARAFVVEHKKSGKKLAFANLEICFCTIAIKDAVVKRLQKLRPELGYTDANLMVSGQHTHSGPGGYSHYLLYNLTIPGFQPEVFDTIVNGTVEAIMEAEENKLSGRIRFAEGGFAPDVDVAFIRSLPAYNANKDVERKLGEDEAHLGVNRNMQLLLFETSKGRPTGSINWFGVHTTSLSNDNLLICSDNKGYAAGFLEQEIAQSGKAGNFTAAFAQSECGDVTPNYIWDDNKKWTRGKYENDFESAKHNGKLQSDMAAKLIGQAREKGEELKGDLDYILMYVDFSNVEVDHEFANAGERARTGFSALAFSFLEGTVEGPGLPKLLGHAGRGASRLIDTFRNMVVYPLASKKRQRDMRILKRAHGNKRIALETGTGHILGTRQLDKLILPASADPLIKTLKRLGQHGLDRHTPWIPHILPVQIFIIGNTAFLGLAAEITTIAGKRLKERVLKILRQRKAGKIERVILCPYSNGYHGYITTPEEYGQQFYEGGHTVFGKWTLAAYLTKFKELAIQMNKPEAERQCDTKTRPDVFKEEDIWYGFGEEEKESKWVKTLREVYGKVTHSLTPP